MGYIESPTNPMSVAEVDGPMRALRVTERPMEALGYYRWSGSTTNIPSMAGPNDLFHFRWVDPENIALIQYMRLRVLMVTLMTAQELCYSFDLASQWTVDGANGQTAVLTHPNLVKRTSFPGSKVGTIRLATSAYLFAGTKTLDASPFLIQSGWSGALGNVPVDMSVDLTRGGAACPIVLTQNEGVVVRNVLTQNGGNLRMSMEIAWAECTPEQFPSF